LATADRPRSGRGRWHPLAGGRAGAIDHGVDRGDTSFRVHLTGPVVQETVFGWVLIEPL